MSSPSADNRATVVPIDCDYVYPGAAAAYLMIEGDRAAVVENNPARAVPRQLEVQGAHPRAVRHIVNPERLVASSREVYGAELFQKLYGEIKGVSAERVRSMADEEELAFGTRTLRFLHTRGHADHHFCVFDSRSRGIFTGDSFGIGYAALQSEGPFLYPSTTPTQFHADEARRSVDRIAGSGATHAYLTHFGAFDDLAAGAAQMHSGLDAMESVFVEARESAVEGEDLQKICAAGVRKYFDQKLRDCGLTLGPFQQQLLELDLDINAMGLAYAAGRARKQR